MRISLFAILVLFPAFYGEAQVIFQGTYPGAHPVLPSSFCKTPEGGYAVCSASDFFGNNFDGCLIKTDSLGNVTWAKTYGWTAYEKPSKVILTNDGGYLIAGSIENWGPGASNIYIARIDSSGNLLWSKFIGGSSIDLATDAAQTKDGGFIIGGITTSFGAGDSDYLLVRIDASGDTLWTRTYGGTGQEECYAVNQTMDSGYILAGYTNLSGGIPHACLLKTDSSGNFSWMKVYAGSYIDEFYDVVQTTDSGFILTGWNFSDVILVRTDAYGDTLWTRTFGGASDDIGKCVRQTSDGGFIITGYSYSFPVPDEDVYLVKTDASGNLMWSWVYNEDNNITEMGFQVEQTSDGGYAVLGNNGIGAFYFIKTDPTGWSGCGNAVAATQLMPYVFQTSNAFPITGRTNSLVGYNTVGDFSQSVSFSPLCVSKVDESVYSSEVEIFPIPASEYLHVRVSDEKIKSVKIFSASGVKKVNVEKENKFTPNKAETIINISQLSAGIYILAIETIEKTIFRKLIIN